MATKRTAPKKKAEKKDIVQVAPSVWVVDGKRYFSLADAEEAARG